MPHIRVSREFEPVPELAVEARYTFKFTDGELNSVKLSKRHVKDGHNSQFGKIEDLDLDKVPNSVIAQAQDELRTLASSMEVHHA